MKNLIIIFVFSITLSSCSKELNIKSQNNPIDLYDEFWNHVNDNYIYFDKKNVNWNEVYKTHSSTITTNSTEEELLQAMENSMLELRDAHNRISTPFRNGKKYNYKAGYEIHFSLDLVERKYIVGNFKTQRSFRYGNINKETIYIFVPKMEYIFELKRLIRTLVNDKTKNLIIDVRNNGGGNSNPVPSLLGDFVAEKTLLGNYIEKTGPQREDESTPVPIYASPNDEFHFDLNVILLINRKGYSATSYLAGMCKGLENFTLVGQVTGGGGGGNAGFELSNGWRIAVSVSDFIDKNGMTIENGVRPDIAIENSENDIIIEQDKMLERVLELLK